MGRSFEGPVPEEPPAAPATREKSRHRSCLPAAEGSDGAGGADGTDGACAPTADARTQLAEIELQLEQLGGAGCGWPEHDHVAFTKLRYRRDAGLQPRLHRAAAFDRGRPPSGCEAATLWIYSGQPCAFRLLGPAAELATATAVAVAAGDASLKMRACPHEPIRDAASSTCSCSPSPYDGRTPAEI